MDAIIEAKILLIRRIAELEGRTLDPKYAPVEVDRISKMQLSDLEPRAVPNACGLYLYSLRVPTEHRDKWLNGHIARSVRNERKTHRAHLDLQDRRTRR